MHNTMKKINAQLHGWQNMQPVHSRDGSPIEFLILMAVSLPPLIMSKKDAGKHDPVHTVHSYLTGPTIPKPNS